MIYIYTYIVIAILFGLYSSLRQKIRYTDHSEFFKLLVVFVFNFVLFPIGLITSLLNNEFLLTKKDIKKIKNLF